MSSDFCTADSNLAVSETLTDAAIVQSVSADNAAGESTSAAGAGDNDDDNGGDDDDTDDSREHAAVSTADAMNALTVLRDWLECNTTGDNNGFDHVAELENFIITCRPKQQTSITDFFRNATA